MHCERIEVGGVTAIVCMSGKRARCGFCAGNSSRLCDGPPRAKSRKKTCSAPLCATHAKRVGEDRDLCPDCAGDAERAAAAPLTTTVEVWTARLDRRVIDPDLLDVTRKSGLPGEGLPFAPSWDILAPALAARRAADALRRRANAEGTPMHEAADTDQAAHHIEEEAWERYVPVYLAEMLVSSVRPIPEGWERLVEDALARGVKLNPEAWARLYARPRVVLACYCSGAHCHRFLLARILGKLGATLKGELPLPASSQLSLTGEVARG